MFEKIKINVHERIHLFITFAGTISTIDLDRSTFFRKIIEKKEFGYISKITEKLLYFAKSWNLGFAVTCRQLEALSPSRILADFLDRLAVTIDFGEPLEVFLQALENVKPRLEVKSRRVGGATYQVPLEVPQERQTAVAMRWIAGFARGRKSQPMDQALAAEIMDAYDNTGSAIKKRDDTHKMAAANKAFAHYRW